LVNKLFRAVHTIKGGSRLIEIRKIESLSHELENVLDAVRAGRSQLNDNLIDVALECVKRIRLITDEVAHRGPITIKVNDLILALKAGGESVTQKPNTTTQQKNENVSVKNATIADEKIEKQNSKVKISRDESIKVSSEKLDAVLDTAAEVYINRIRLDNENRLLKQSINELTADLEKFKQHVPVVVENKINNRVVIGQKWNFNSKNEEIVANQSHDTVFSGPYNEMTMALERINLQVDALQQNIEDLEVLSSRLQSGAMNFRMVPIIQLFSRFPAQVRDIARQIDKNVELKLTGGETELDKIIVNQLGDPLLHIMRNSIDHGIENREDRISQKKPEVGQINLRAYYSGSNAVIEIEDDGKGINKNVILKKALEKGMIGEEQIDNLQDKEIFDLIFEPGFSSAEQVTELSGRGVGMDVVKTAITQMQGSVKIESKLGIGTKIILKLPLTLAVIGILLASENDHEFINVKFLSDLLEFPKSPNLRAQHYLVVLNDGEDKIGIIVDDVKGQQNVLLKQTGSLIAKIPYVMGCTILSSSKLVLILNVLELSQVPNDSKSIKLSTQEKTYNDLESLRLLKKLLIVDDSQMQRKRISDHLLGSGYRVLEAPDGYQALKLSESTFFDAFLVDLQMPVMDGYEFIASIRKASSYRNVPIIVISGGQTNRDGITTALEKFDIVDFFEKPVDLNRLVSVLDNSILPLKSVVEGG
jgi:two-component system chemotaxis sensor kinase CheA